MDYAIIVGLLLGAIFLLYMANWLLGERYVARGVAAVLFAAVILGSMFYRVIPAMTDTESVRLNESIAALTKEATELKADKAKLQTDTKRLTADYAAGVTRIGELEHKRSDDLDLIGREIADVRARLAEPSSGLTIERAVILERGDDIDKVRASIRNLSSLRPRTPAVAPASAAALEPSRELSQLRDKMGAKLSTPSYDVEVYPDKELVRGRQGRYYVVDMKNATSGIRYFFPGGKYVLSVGNQEFRSSLNAFVADILSKFEGKVRYDLFVRGTADGKPYEGRFEPGYEFRSIKYIRSLGADKYGTETAQRDVADTVHNADLPDLRAAFMQKLIADIYPLKRPDILEGTVTGKTDDHDRNAELILFVDW